MEQVTEEMLNKLVEKFFKYTETAEQHEFVMLAMIHENINHTQISEIVKDQAEARAMYRVIASAIGEDYSMFKESV